MSARRRRLIRLGIMGGWTPEVLFSQNQEGAWYDPSDLSTLYQDSAGTTPVTTAGDPVGLMLDKSGNGNHATQTTDAARPTYQTDGTLHWLQFDGSDDRINPPQITYQAGDSLAVFIAVQKTGTQLRYASFRSRKGSLGEVVGLSHPSTMGSTSDIGGDIYVNGEPITDDRVVLHDALSPAPAVGSSLGGVATELNGVDGEIVTYGGSSPPAARLYGYIEVVGLTTPRRTVEEYLAGKAGATLS